MLEIWDSSCCLHTLYWSRQASMSRSRSALTAAHVRGTKHQGRSHKAQHTAETAPAANIWLAASQTARMRHDVQHATHATQETRVTQVAGWGFAGQAAWQHALPHPSGTNTNHAQLGSSCASILKPKHHCTRHRAVHTQREHSLRGTAQEASAGCKPRRPRRARRRARALGKQAQAHTAPRAPRVPRVPRVSRVPRALVGRRR